MKYWVWASAAVTAAALYACGGGGTSSPPIAVVPTSSSSPLPSVSGDMIAAVANKGWNYSGTVTGQAVTFTLYTDPTQGSIIPLIGITAAATNASAATAYAGGRGVLQGGVGLTNTVGTYTAQTFELLYSTGQIFSSGAVPTTPLLVPNSLTLNQVLTTYPGVTATVTTVGTVAGASACPTPASGATVTYVYQGQTTAISYVPGCGITALTTNGVSLTLTSVGSYPQLGTLASARLASGTLLDTARSLLNSVAHGMNWRFNRNDPN